MRPKYQILLLDAMNLLHRAAHSYSDLSIMDGDEMVPTGAVFGFLQMAVSTWKKYADTNCEVIVCWDAGYDHRVALYPEYKANRRKPRDPGEEVSEQFATLPSQGKALRKILSVAGWKQAKAPGFEADDVMATLGKRYSESGSQVALYTGDQDLHQCVTDRVHVIAGKGGKEAIWTPAEVVEKWGLPPERVAEAKALAGDSGDNIPGCPGCGIGWAQKILQGRDVREALRSAREGLTLHGEYQGKPWKTPSLTKKLAENEGIILTSWELSKVIFDAPVDISTQPQDPELLKRFLFSLRFHSLLEEDNFQGLCNIAAKSGPSKAPQDIDSFLGF